MVLDSPHLAVLLAILAGLAFACGPLAASWLVAPRARGGALGEPYECGVPAHGPGQARLVLPALTYALVFLAFEVDVLYLFPMAVSGDARTSLLAVGELLLFLGVLAGALVYFRKKGMFA